MVKQNKMAMVRRTMDNVKVEDVRMEDPEWKEVNPLQVPAFKFEKEGDSIVGVYQRMKADVGENHSNLYTLTEEATGADHVVWGSEVLDNRMANIKPGTLIKITFLGKKPSQKNPKRSYNDYAVYTRNI